MKITQITKKTVLEVSGIYVIRNLVNNKVYIGQSTNIYRRWIGHKHEFLNGKHGNPHLQHSFNKYGINSFDFSVLEYCDENQLTNREKCYINIQQGELYNVREATEHPGGKRKVVSEEQKRKTSLAMKGKNPKNLADIQKARRRKIAYHLNGELVQIFDSCTLAAEYFGMLPKIFNMYIGRNLKQKSKYFQRGAKVIYYE